MRAPAFWHRPGVTSRLLAPLGLLTAAVTARRVARPGFDCGIPVICAGNATVGGAGKTIVARDLLARLGAGTFALTRGYGGCLDGPVLVDPAMHSAAEVGDEALLLAMTAPTILARDRAAGARLARQLGATAIVMDDGLQNPGLLKSRGFLVVDGGYGFGNGQLLPAGPLREPVAAAAARCRAAILIGEDTTGAAAALPPGLPVLRAHLIPSCDQFLAGRAVIAFAGIGRPQKFYASVTELGATIVRRRSYQDHHSYTEADAAALLASAARHRAAMVTTEKDFVKLPAKLRAQSIVVTVRLAWEDEQALAALLASRSQR